MTQNNAAAASKITIIPSSHDNLHAAIDALHAAQITGEYRYTAMGMAGALITEIGIVFPMHMVLIYMATSAKRRQVWHAYIAAMHSNSAHPQPITSPDALRAKLINTSSKTLLQEAYGTVPEGYATAIFRLGLEGQQPEIYLLLHKFMTDSAEHRKAFSHAAKIDASTLTTMVALPEPLQSYELAKQFRGSEDIKTMTFIIDTLAQGDAAKYAMLCAKVVDAAKRGHSISKVLQREYFQTPFPEPAVADTDFCKHISSCDDLSKAAAQFSNCLRQYHEEGIRGEYQYYRWYEAGKVEAIISVREDAPFGYRLTEIKGKKNAYIDDELELKIIKYFEDLGIYKAASMEGLLRELGALGVLNRVGRGDAVDAIHGVIDELLDDGPI